MVNSAKKIRKFCGTKSANVMAASEGVRGYPRQRGRRLRLVRKRENIFLQGTISIKIEEKNI